MIYASDLDRTLIYSKSFLEGYSGEVVPVEENTNGEVISYISKMALENLKEISSKIDFIPVTTRSFQEYKRTLFFDMVPFAIIDNGGCILYYGKPIAEWEERLSRILREYNLESVVEMFDGKSFVSRKPSIIDGKFVFFKQMDEIACMNFCKDNLDSRLYTFEIQRKKVYIIPRFISKQNALRYLVQAKNCQKIIASGDSALDEGIIKASNFAVVPRHSTMNFDNLLDNNYVVTEAEGLECAEEITTKVLENIG